MGAQTKFYEEWAICGVVDPVDANNTDSDSSVVDMSKFSEVAIVITTGVVNASGSDTITIKDCATSGGSYAAISGKSLSLTAGNYNSKQYIISVRSDEMNANARYLKLTQDNSAHSQLMAVIIFGRPVYGPAKDSQLTTVQSYVD